VPGSSCRGRPAPSSGGATSLLAASIISEPAASWKLKTSLKSLMKQPLSRRLPPGTYVYYFKEEADFRGRVYKSEIRNPKQYSKTQFQISKTIEIQI